MTTTSETITADEADLEALGEQLVRNARAGGARAAARALVDEGTILARKNVRAALLVDTPNGAACRWEGLAGKPYTLGLEKDQRGFLLLLLSLVGIGHTTIAAVQDLDERRLLIMLRAILQTAGNNSLTVGKGLRARRTRGRA